DLLTSGLDRIAVRIPRHPMALQLLEKLSFPLAAPSANPFGYVSPTTPQHVAEQLGEQVPYILDGGPCTIGLESTILGFEHNKIIVHRLGGLKLEQIQDELGPVQLHLNQSSNPQAPGMLKSHYAPHKRVVIGEIPLLLTEQAHSRIGIISFKDSYHHSSVRYQNVLSPEGDLDEAATKLFSALRDLDTANIDIILTHEFPNEGLGKAINDRLMRASAR
ncbi:MAG: L-threonylcarbamoyladenylate synthase, partial [Cyclobacteriaceae bacterium]|nr:L-threonylcarbamoyladenylate synthase [Cyclobacteriaceae bacterium HetDA_MAG_MS6]